MKLPILTTLSYVGVTGIIGGADVLIRYILGQRSANYVASLNRLPNAIFTESLRAIGVLDISYIISEMVGFTTGTINMFDKGIADSLYGVFLANVITSSLMASGAVQQHPKWSEGGRLSVQTITAISSAGFMYWNQGDRTSVPVKLLTSIGASIAYPIVSNLVEASYDDTIQAEKSDSDLTEMALMLTAFGYGLQKMIFDSSSKRARHALPLLYTASLGLSTVIYSTN
jgi:hypothetical protein